MLACTPYRPRRQQQYVLAVSGRRISQLFQYIDMYQEFRLVVVAPSNTTF